jgi:hypothetical protein
MAIKPHCAVVSCQKELNEAGAILISPPTCGESGEGASNVVKIHICKECYNTIVDSFGLKL